MTLLPIVERELRLAARRRFTMWSRLAAAGLALLIFGALQLLFMLASKGMGTGFPAGQIQFAILKWLCFIFACAAGVFLTSDALSEEKREGTLGLLFLTDLRGHDVVLGKFISSSTQAAYALLAAFPILGLALLGGGVTGGDFWKALLIISNTLFISLAAGIAVSSISRDALKAMNAAVALMLVLLWGPHLADWARAGFDSTMTSPLISLASPWYLFTQAGTGRHPDFWPCLGIQHALGWGLLALTSFFTPRTWQDKRTGVIGRRTAFLGRWKWGAAARAVNARRRRGQNPVLWLASRDRWLARLLWGITLLGTAALLWTALNYKIIAPTSPVTATTTTNGTTTVTTTGGTTTYTTSSGSSSFVLSTAVTTRVAYGVVAYLASALRPLMEIWMALLASRFFVDAIRNGAMELILVAPLGPEQVVRSQWAALWRVFRMPAALVALMYLVNGVISIWAMQAAMGGTAMPGGNPMLGYLAGNLVAGMVGFVANLTALSWFGMWMGVTNRKTSIAVLKSFGFVIALPWLALMFVNVFVMGLTVFSVSRSSSPFGGLSMMWLGPAVAGLLNLIKDIAFIKWSRQRLFNDLRGAVSVGINPPVRQKFYPLPVVRPPPVPVVAMAPAPAAEAVEKREN